MEDVAATLNTLVQPTSTSLFLVDGDRVCLTTAIVDGVNKGDIELVRVLRKVVRAAHT